jgi:hypothetical protein
VADVLEDVLALLADTHVQMQTVEDLYRQAVESGVSPRALKPRIKNVLENQRSVLDYMAYVVHQWYGKPTGSKIYYPMSSRPKYFRTDIDQRMPGVRNRNPRAAAAIKRHQPFNQEWMVWLNDLRNEQAHRVLSPHSRHDTTRIEMQFPDGGWVPVNEFQVKLGDGRVVPPTDAAAALDYPTREVPMIEWRFASPPLDALYVLDQIQRGLGRCWTDVSVSAPI